MHASSRPLLLALLAVTCMGCSSCTRANPGSVRPDDPAVPGEAHDDDQTVLAGSGGGADQGPVTFRIVNVTGQPRFLDWDGTTELIECAQQRGRSWQECHFRPPFCVAECAEDPGAQSCPECARPPNQVRRLRPGEHVDLEWPGRLHVLRDDGRRCPCYRAPRPSAGRYRARVCSYPAASCSVEAECQDPDGDGILNDSGPSGEPACVTVVFDVPRSAPVVEVALQASSAEAEAPETTPLPRPDESPGTGAQPPLPYPTVGDDELACTSDGDCVRTSSPGCCACCPCAPPYAISRAAHERRQAQCALVRCRQITGCTCPDCPDGIDPSNDAVCSQGRCMLGSR